MFARPIIRRSSGRLALFAAAAVTATFVGCAGGSGRRPDSADGGSGGDEANASTGGSGGRMGRGGSSGQGGSGGSAGTGGGVATGGNADAAGAGSGGTISIDSGTAPDSGGLDGTGAHQDGPGPAGGWAGVAGIEDLSTVKMSLGCGKPAPAGLSSNSYAERVLTISPKPIRGSGMRRYTVKLPPNYDNKKPYRMIFFAPGCTGTTPPFGDFTSFAGSEGVVQAVLQIEPGVGTYPQCFDDKRTDSIEYAYFERVLDDLKSQVCIDEHRVFVGGHSSGAWLSNQLGCVYGSTLIRGIFPASGGLAVSPLDDVMGVRSAPPCKGLPTPGIWIHNQDDTINRPVGTQNAIERALRVNRCTSTDFKGPREPYLAPMTGMDCEKYSTCPPEFPVVYCHRATGGHPPPPYTAAAAWQYITLMR